MRYYLVRDADLPVSLLRRVPGPDGSTVAEALGRDRRWHPTDRFATLARNGEYELEEVSPGRAQALIQHWWAAR